MRAAPHLPPCPHLLDCPRLRHAIEQRARRLARGLDLDAEDLASIGRLALLENPLDVAPDGRAPFGYALATAGNAMKDAIRSERRMRAKETRTTAIALLSSHQQDAANGQPTVHNDADALGAAIAALPADERAVVLGVDLAGATLATIATDLSVSGATACRLRKSAHDRLRRILASAGGRGCSPSQLSGRESSAASRRE